MSSLRHRFNEWLDCEEYGAFSKATRLCGFKSHSTLHQYASGEHDLPWPKALALGDKVLHMSLPDIISAWMGDAYERKIKEMR